MSDRITVDRSEFEELKRLFSQMQRDVSQIKATGSAKRLSCDDCGSADMAVIPSGETETLIVCNACGSSFTIPLLTKPKTGPAPEGTKADDETGRSSDDSDGEELTGKGQDFGEPSAEPEDDEQLDTTESDDDLDEAEPIDGYDPALEEEERQRKQAEHDYEDPDADLTDDDLEDGSGWSDEDYDAVDDEPELDDSDFPADEDREDGALFDDDGYPTDDDLAESDLDEQLDDSDLEDDGGLLGIERFAGPDEDESESGVSSEGSDAETSADEPEDGSNDEAEQAEAGDSVGLSAETAGSDGGDDQADEDFDSDLDDEDSDGSGDEDEVFVFAGGNAEEHTDDEVIEEASIEPEYVPPSTGVELSRRQIEDMQSRAFYSKIGNILQDNKLDRYTTGQRRGKLDARSFYKVPTGSNRIFKKKTERKNKNYNVVIVFDGSGSMSGYVGSNDGHTWSRMSMARELTRLLVTGLEKYDIHFAIMRYAGRVDVYKRFDDEYDYRQLAGFYAGGNTSTYLGLYSAFEMLRKNPSDGRNIVVHISDGTPGSSSVFKERGIGGPVRSDDGSFYGMAQPNRKYATESDWKAFDSSGSSERLSELPKRMKKAGVDLVNISIDCANITKYFPDAAVVRSREEFIAAVLGSFKKLIKRG